MLYKLGHLGIGHHTIKKPSSPATTPDGYDVILLAGQSNMVGRDGPIDPVLDATNPRIFQYGNDGDIVSIAADPLDHVDETADTIGLGLSFAKALLPSVASNRNILLVPVAAGGTAFSTGYWEVGGTGYNNAVAQANAAMGQGEGTNKIVSILWHQGESDAALTQAQYSDYLDNLIYGFRSSITGADATTPLVVGEVPSWSTGYGAGVADALLDTPDRVLYTSYVETSDLTNRGDNLHFDAVALRTLGGRYNTALPIAQANIFEPEATAIRHWILGDDNPDMTDLIASVDLVENNFAPTFKDGYLTIAGSGHSGLLSDIADNNNQTVVVVCRTPDSLAKILAGALGISSVIGGTSIYQNNGQLSVNNRGTGSTNIGAEILNEWFFMSYSLSTLQRAVFLGNEAGSSYSAFTAAIVVADPVRNVALGNAHYTSGLDAGFDAAEFIIFAGSKTEVELEAIYQRSSARLASRGIDIA